MGFNRRLGAEGRYGRAIRRPAKGSGHLGGRCGSSGPTAGPGRAIGGHQESNKGGVVLPVQGYLRYNCPEHVDKVNGGTFWENVKMP